MSEAVTREETLLNAIATGGIVDIVPVTRKEKYLRYLAGVGEKPSKPITREEMFLDLIQAGGGGITPTGDINITENGEFDVTEFAKAIVNVASSGGGSFDSGTITIASASNTSIYHNLEKPPNFFIWIVSDTTNPTRSGAYGSTQISSNSSYSNIFCGGVINNTAFFVRGESSNSYNNCSYYIAPGNTISEGSNSGRNYYTLSTGYIRGYGAGIATDMVGSTVSWIAGVI